MWKRGKERARSYTCGAHAKQTMRWIINPNAWDNVTCNCHNSYLCNFLSFSMEMEWEEVERSARTARPNSYNLYRISITGKGVILNINNESKKIITSTCECAAHKSKWKQKPNERREKKNQERIAKTGMWMKYLSSNVLRWQLALSPLSLSLPSRMRKNYKYCFFSFLDFFNYYK